METQPQPVTKSFAQQAAMLSWVCPACIFLLSIVSKQAGLPPIVIDLAALVLMVAGFSFGIVALLGISKQGTKGILLPAIVGIIISGFLLFIFVTNFVAARAKATQQHSAIETSPVVAVVAAVARPS